ncbi:MAG: ATP-binding protein [Eubacteriales bacterium]|jgi:hypothetical protein
MIEQLHIDSYGGLHQREIRLEPGLNLLYGPNEAGKSTVTSFLRAMLYGLPVTRARGIAQNDRKRYRPWDREAFRGSLLYRTRQGRQLRVERTFRATAARDILRVTDAATGQELPQYAGGLGEALFGISAETFENTAFVRQGETRVTRNDELVARINNLVSTASEEVGYEASLRQLKTLKDQLRRERGKNGELDVLEDKQRKLEERRRQLEEDYQLVLERMQRLSGVEEELARQQQLLEDNRSARDFQECERLAGEYGRILQLRLEIRNLEGSMESTRGYIRVGDRVPSREDAEKLTAAMEEQERAEQALEEVRQELDSLKEEEAAQARNPLCAQPDVEADAQRAKELRDRMLVIDTHLQARGPVIGQRDRLRDRLAESRSPQTAFLDRESERVRAEELLRGSGSGMNPVWLPGALVLALVTVALFLWDWRFGLAGLVLTGLWMVLVPRQRQGRQGAREFLRRNGLRSLQELEERYRRWQEENARRQGLEVQLREMEQMLAREDESALREEHARLEKTLAELLRKYRCEGEEQLRELARQAGEAMLRLKFLKEELARRRAVMEKRQEALTAARHSWQELAERCLPPVQGRDAEKRALEELTRHVARLEEKQLQLTEKQGFLQELTQGADEEKWKEAYQQYREWKASGQVPKGQAVEDNTRRVMELAQEKSSLEAQIHSYFEGEEAVSQVLWQLQQTGEELREGQQRYDALSLAYDTLVQAMEEMSRDFSPRLTQAVGENLRLLTDGRYDTLLIDKDYNIRVCRADDSASWELEYFSAGTVDQIYLAFRLALLDIVGGEEPLPLILDDCFCHYDDGRLGRAMEMLAKIAENRQILLLTCQNREENFLKSMANYHKVVV